jgi:putative phosphoribosyl transferase
LVDELICPLRPTPFLAVGLWYDHFPPITDEDVRKGIAEAAESAKSHRNSEAST